MATRQQLTIWIPVALAVLFTVGYVELRTSRTAGVAPTREPLGAASVGEKARGSEAEQRAFALAAAANARAQRAEQSISDVQQQLAERAANGATEDTSVAPTPAEDRERQRVEREVFLAELDERFATEPVNQAFRSENESAIANTAAALRGHGVTLEDAECASSMCKVRLSHPGHGRLPQSAVMELIKAAQTPGSALARLAFNFKYEEGATTLYGTTSPSAEGDETRQ